METWSWDGWVLPSFGKGVGSGEADQGGGEPGHLGFVLFVAAVLFILVFCSQASSFPVCRSLGLWLLGVGQERDFTCPSPESPTTESLQGPLSC